MATFYPENTPLGPSRSRPGPPLPQIHPQMLRQVGQGAQDGFGALVAALHGIVGQGVQALLQLRQGAGAALAGQQAGFAVLRRNRCLTPIYPA